MIEGGYPRHVCIDLTHITSQSKIFDTSRFLQVACQVLPTVTLDPKSPTELAIETKVNCLAGSVLPPPQVVSVGDLPFLE